MNVTVCAKREARAALQAQVGELESSLASTQVEADTVEKATQAAIAAKNAELEDMARELSAAKKSISSMEERLREAQVRLSWGALFSVCTQRCAFIFPIHDDPA